MVTIPSAPPKASVEGGQITPGRRGGQGLLDRETVAALCPMRAMVVSATFMVMSATETVHPGLEKITEFTSRISFYRTRPKEMSAPSSLRRRHCECRSLI